MGAPDVLAQLSALGVRLSREGDTLLASPRSALTDELRALIRAHKPELLAALPAAPGRATEPQDAPHGAPQGTGTAEPAPAHRPIPEAVPAALSAYDCTGCDHLEMREEPQPGTRRRFFWRCAEGFELLEGRNYGERVVLAPPECEAAGGFKPWKAGTK